MRNDTYQLLDRIADSFNPLLALLALSVPLLRAPRRLRPAVAYYLGAAVAIAAIYLVGALDQRLGLWPALGLDYSTHSAFAASLVVSAGTFLRRAWSSAWVPLAFLLALYFGLVLILRYHSPLDVVTSATPAALVAALTARATRGPQEDGLGGVSGR